MLTDLLFIAPNKPWPPEDPDEAARLREHAFNRMLYNNLHKEIFQEASKNYKVDDEGNIIIILGWAAKATRNYVSLCIGEAPDVEIDEVDAVEVRPDEEVLIDASRYGIGLYEPTQDGIFAQNPENCYLVNAPGNIRKVTEYVFFSQFPVEKQTFIKFTIHGKGYIQHLIYELKDGKLGERQNLADYPAYAGLNVDDKGIQKTGVDDILIVRVDNALSSDRRYGQSDYTPAAVSQIRALEETFTDRKKVLRKFAKPVLMAPESAFNHFNHARQVWEIHLDEPIIAEPGSMEAKYLTWQAELGAVENAIKDMLDQLLQELDLVKQEELGQASSGTALAFRLLPTRSRVRKFATGLKTAIPKVLSLKSKLDVALGVPGAGAPFEASEVSVTMQDGIPRDPVQDTTWATLAFQNQGMSLETYICVTQGLEYDENPDSAMMKEVSRIKGAQEEARKAMPESPKVELPALGDTNAGQNQ